MSQPFSREQYQDAIKHLELGSTQLIPDGKPCVICASTYHYAFQCASNPLKALDICQKASAEPQEQFQGGTPLRFMASWDHKEKKWLLGFRVAPPGFIDPNNGD